jgi:hypothetical protein
MTDAQPDTKCNNNDTPDGDPDVDDPPFRILRIVLRIVRGLGVCGALGYKRCLLAVR